MIDKLYGKYFQKSRSFLYPALGIKRTSSTMPSGTYVSLTGKIEPEDIKLICTFQQTDSEEFKLFEEQMLLSNPLFVEKIPVKDYNLYVFDLEIYQADYFNFLLGKYSRLSAHLKRAIKNYYGEKSAEYKYIETYLHPEKYFEVYAKLLDIDVETLKASGELCDPCDLNKETLKIPQEDLEVINKIS
jgi:hypothetical protein